VSFRALLLALAATEAWGENGGQPFDGSDVPALVVASCAGFLAVYLICFVLRWVLFKRRKHQVSERDRTMHLDAAAVPLFDGADPLFLERLSHEMVDCSFEAGDTIIAAGESDEVLHVLLAGVAQQRLDSGTSSAVGRKRRSFVRSSMQAFKSFRIPVRGSTSTGAAAAAERGTSPGAWAGGAGPAPQALSERPSSRGSAPRSGSSQSAHAPLRSPRASGSSQDSGARAAEAAPGQQAGAGEGAGAGGRLPGAEASELRTKVAATILARAGAPTGGEGEILDPRPCNFVLRVIF
jgi:hypothetical protein